MYSRPHARKEVRKCPRYRGRRRPTRGRARLRSPLRGSRGWLHGRIRDLYRGRGPDAAPRRVARRPLSDPALGVRHPGRAHVHRCTRGAHQGGRGALRPRGHTLTADAGAEIVFFSPTLDRQQTLEIVKENRARALAPPDPAPRRDVRGARMRPSPSCGTPSARCSSWAPETGSRPEHQPGRLRGGRWRTAAPDRSGKGRCQRLRRRRVPEFSPPFPPVRREPTPRRPRAARGFAPCSRGSR